MISSVGRATVRLDASSGLTDLLVNEIYKDSAGYIWLGTELGVDRYDGHHLQSYTYGGHVRGNCRVAAILQGADGEILVGSPQGLFTTTAEGFGLQRPGHYSQLSGDVRDLCTDGEGRYFAATRHGVWCWHGRGLDMHRMLLTPDATSAANSVTALAATHHGIAAVSASMVAVIDASTGQITRYEYPASAAAGHMVAVGDTLLIGTKGEGILRLDLASGRYAEPFMPGNGNITGMGLHADGSLTVSTDGSGVITLHPRSGAVLSYRDTQSAVAPLATNSVYSLLVDDFDIEWIGFFQMGLQYEPRRQEIFSTVVTEGFDSRNKAVRAIATDPRGGMMVGTRDGLYFNDPQGKTRSWGKAELGSAMVFALCYHNGLYYIGTYGAGAWTYNAQTGRLERLDGGDASLRTASVWDFTVASDGNVWVAASDGLRIYRQGHLTTHYTSQNSQLPKGFVYEVYFDSTGRAWIVTDSGLAIHDGKTLHADRFPEGFAPAGEKLRHVFEDSRHGLWFAPDRGPLMCADIALTEVKAVRSSQISESDPCMCITEDSEGMLWIGSETGLTRYNPDDGSYRRFNLSHGLPDMIFTACWPVADQQGGLYWGNARGLVHLPAEMLGRLESEGQRLRFTALSSHGRDVTHRVDAEGHLTLSPGEQDVEIFLSDFCYTDPLVEFVEYRMDTDRQWHSLPLGQPLRLFGLEAGAHTVRMRLAGDADSELSLGINRSRGVGAVTLTLLGLTLLLGGALCRLWVAYRRQGMCLAELQSAAGGAAAASQPKEETYKTITITDKECRLLAKRLDKVMQQQEPFLNQDFKASDLAQMLDTSVHTLSYLLNQHLGTSFYDYVNSWRVERFKHLVATDADASRYTLSAMAQMCGFSSRASFFRHFKAATGKTPSEYIRGSKGVISGDL